MVFGANQLHAYVVMYILQNDFIIWIRSFHYSKDDTTNIVTGMVDIAFLYGFEQRHAEIFREPVTFVHEERTFKMERVDGTEIGSMDTSTLFFLTSQQWLNIFK